MSGNLTSVNGSPSETLAEPYQSMGFNRYAAGWVSSDQVLLYRGGPRSVKLSEAGGDGRQLIVLPQGAQGFYVVLETRLPSTTTRYLGRPGESRRTASTSGRQPAATIPGQTPSPPASVSSASTSSAPPVHMAPTTRSRWATSAPMGRSKSQ